MINSVRFATTADVANELNEKLPKWLTVELEHGAENPSDEIRSPVKSSNRGSSSMVESQFSKLIVAGSNPVFRSSAPIAQLDRANGF